MAERIDPDAPDEVEQRVSVDIGDGAPDRMVDHDARHDRVALEAGGDVLVLALPERDTPGPRHDRPQVDLLVAQTSLADVWFALHCPRPSWKTNSRCMA